MLSHLQDIPRSGARPWAANVKAVILWKPQLLKKLGDLPRRKLDRWISQGKFPPPDGVKHGHPYWKVQTIDTWLATE